MISPAKVWSCDYCPVQEVQHGPRAESMPPIPPEGWHLITVSKLIPKHSETTAQGTVKVGDALDTTQRAVCSSCMDIYHPNLK